MATVDYERILHAVLRELDRAGAMELIDDAEKHLPPRDCLALHHMREAAERAGAKRAKAKK